MADPFGLTKATTVTPAVKDAYRQLGENAFQTPVAQGIDEYAMEQRRKTANMGKDIELPKDTPRTVNGIHTAAGTKGF